MAQEKLGRTNKRTRQLHERAAQVQLAAQQQEEWESAHYDQTPYQENRLKIFALDSIPLVPTVRMLRKSFPAFNHQYQTSLTEQRMGADTTYAGEALRDKTFAIIYDLVRSGLLATVSLTLILGEDPNNLRPAITTAMVIGNEVAAGIITHFENSFNSNARTQISMAARGRTR